MDPRDLDPLHEAGYGARPQDDPYAGRRQCYELTADELRAQPAWWFPGTDAQLAGPDQATVMPVEVDAHEGPLEFPPGRYLLHAAFTLADGTHIDGHVSFDPEDRGTLGEREPMICTEHGQIGLWFGVLTPSASDLRTAFAWLQRERDDVFPMTWRTRLHPPSGALAGQLDGFAIWRDGAVAWL